MTSAVPAEKINERLATLNTTGHPVYQWEEQNPDLSLSLDPFLVIEFLGGSGDQMTVGAPKNNWWEEDGIFNR